MKQILKFVCIFILFGAFNAKADLYTATNVEMSGTGNSPVEAKNNALTAGEITGFDQMLSALVGTNNTPFLERPTDDEILSMVRDISILEEKNTGTSYWGKMNVRFKEIDVQELLKKNNITYLKKAPPVYWLIPVWKQGTDVKTLEDENPFYQALKTTNKLSDSFQIILPNGDVNELIQVEHALAEGDFSGMETTVFQNKAEQILVIEVTSFPDNTWVMKPVSYYNTENNFDDLTVQGMGRNSLLDGWNQLNKKMSFLWQNKNTFSKSTNNIYYARINLPQISTWGNLEKELKRLGFLENLKLQGAMPGQLLIRFDYSHSVDELVNQLDKAGWTWEINSETLGTLKRKGTL